MLGSAWLGAGSDNELAVISVGDLTTVSLGDTVCSSFFRIASVAVSLAFDCACLFSEKKFLKSETKIFLSHSDLIIRRQKSVPLIFPSRLAD